MKFYTREKKPKVYSIAVLTAAAALLLFVVVQGAPELLLPYGNLILTVYFAGVILLLLDAFRKQLQYNPYSYNTIFYPGIALFIFSLMGTHAYVTVRCFQDPDSYRDLVVRVAGYSAFFTELCKDVQDEIIRRTMLTKL